MLRVRAQLSFHTFKYGDVFTIDETHPHWAEPLEQGWVAPVDHEVTVPDDGAWKPGVELPAGLDLAEGVRRVLASAGFVPGQPETL